MALLTAQSNMILKESLEIICHEISDALLRFLPWASTFTQILNESRIAQGLPAKHGGPCAATYQIFLDLLQKLHVSRLALHLCS